MKTGVQRPSVMKLDKARRALRTIVPASEKVRTVSIVGSPTIWGVSAPCPQARGRPMGGL